MLRDFCTIRNALEDSQFLRDKRHVRGRLMVTDDHLEILTRLQDAGHIEQSKRDGKNVSYLPDTKGTTVEFTLNPGSLHYYEDLEDLVSYTPEEPVAYYVHGVGDVACEAADGNGSIHSSIASYRQMLRARSLLRSTADFENTGRAIFLTPEKLEIPLAYSSPKIPALEHLKDLQSQFEKRPEQDPADREQRLVLFRKNLREYLKAHPPEDRFQIFLRNFETIYDSYRRDYQLWVGNTFGELEKSFEEKRLKFVADLNGIIAGVQASILAVPVATILLGDKYDAANPRRDLLLAVGVLAVGLIALILLQNQEATLNATREAINATKDDFEKKHTRRKQEFQTRLDNLDTQERRVRKLLGLLRGTIIVIVIASFIGWLYAFSQSGSAPKAPASADTNSPSITPAGTVSNAPHQTNASRPQIP